MYIFLDKNDMILEIIWVIKEMKMVRNWEKLLWNSIEIYFIIFGLNWG